MNLKRKRGCVTLHLLMREGDKKSEHFADVICGLRCKLIYASPFNLKRCHFSQNDFRAVPVVDIKTKVAFGYTEIDFNVNPMLREIYGRICLALSYQNRSIF